MISDSKCRHLKGCLGFIETVLTLYREYTTCSASFFATQPKILRDACLRVKLEGVSTHSFRRTALTMMSNASIPLRVIQEISGHNDLGTLQRYLEVSPEQKRHAVAVI